MENREVRLKKRIILYFTDNNKDDRRDSNIDSNIKENDHNDADAAANNNNYNNADNGIRGWSVVYCYQQG